MASQEWRGMSPSSCLVVGPVGHLEMAVGMEEPLNKRLWSISLLAFALCLSLPAMAQTNFFSDLGPSGNVYQSNIGWTVSGTGAPPGSFTAANEFTSLASGTVTQIDLGVSYVSGFQNSTFYAALYTVNNGLPGTELWNESNLSSTQVFGGCCNLVSITGISGLTLTAGDSYFIVLGASNSGAYMVFNWNSTGATGLDLYSTNG